MRKGRRRSGYLVAVLGVAALVSALLGIWSGDGRWLRTSGAFVVAAIPAVLAWLWLAFEAANE